MYGITLFQVNLVSKKIQSSDYNLSTAQTEIDQLLKYINDFRDKRIKAARHFALEIAEELTVSSQFETENAVRPRKKELFFPLNLQMDQF